MSIRALNMLALVCAVSAILVACVLSLFKLSPVIELLGLMLRMELLFAVAVWLYTQGRLDQEVEHNSKINRPRNRVLRGI
jgi:hypothetical protein